MNRLIYLISITTIPVSVFCQQIPENCTEVEKIKHTKEEWNQILKRESFHILREKGTEKPFKNAYHDNKAEGIYTCAGCDLALFASEDKYDSGTGWPSFKKPICENHLELKKDNTFFTERTEVTCARCEGHIGHVFDDGPAPLGKRYCMNSGAMKFVQKQDSK